MWIVNLGDAWELSLPDSVLCLCPVCALPLGNTSCKEQHTEPNFFLLEPPPSPNSHTSLARKQSWKRLHHVTFLMAYALCLSNHEDLGVVNTGDSMNQLDNSHMWIWWCLCISPEILDGVITGMGLGGYRYPVLAHSYPVGTWPWGYRRHFQGKLKFWSLIWNVLIFPNWLNFSKHCESQTKYVWGSCSAFRLPVWNLCHTHSSHLTWD